VSTAAPLRAICSIVLVFALPIAVAGSDPHEHSGMPTFQTSDRCLACHNGMTNAAGESVSIGADWRTSLMANSSRDPYWQASVRRETIEHSVAGGSIEDECAVCHMPIPRYEAKLAGHPAAVFAHLPLQVNGDRKASDGVSCSVCPVRDSQPRFPRRSRGVRALRHRYRADAGHAYVNGRISADAW
jgi:hypothetical protein